jgi:hypothetical protein
VRQVPVPDVTPFGIVGDGRVARHFLHYFNLLGLSACARSRRASGPCARSARLLPDRVDPVAANVMADASSALTGPLSRGDAQAIAANPKALEGNAFHAVYSAFVRTHDQCP